MVGMVAVAYATLGQRWLQVGKPTAVFLRQPTVRYRRLSSMYLPTVGQRWLKVIKQTVILSTSAHRQLQTSILRVFADIGPTLAQSNKTNSVFPITYNWHNCPSFIFLSQNYHYNGHKIYGSIQYCYIYLTKSCDIAIQSWSDIAKNIQQYWILCPW